MGKENIRLVKYVFLDVVAYTKRTVEAQCDIINVLNKIVRDVLDEFYIPEMPKEWSFELSLPFGRSSLRSKDTHEPMETVSIRIPTGDGICLALMGEGLYFDAHILVAQEILKRIHSHNKQQDKVDYKFEVRIGIHQSDDNLVEDINGKTNVAGGGINNARRIMDLADGSQIIVSRGVYDALYQREKYVNAFRKYRAKVKHDLVLDVYQLVMPNVVGLNMSNPSVFVTPPQSEPSEPSEPILTKMAAYYLAHSIKNETFIVSKMRNRAGRKSVFIMLLWFLAKKSQTLSDMKPSQLYEPKVLPDNLGNNIERQYKWFANKIPFEITLQLQGVVLDNVMPRPIRRNYLDSYADDLVVNADGKAKLKKDWPEIWEEFGLGEL